MTKPVSLALHKNTRAQRRARDLRNQISKCGHYAARNLDSPLAGYAVVVWDENGQGTAFWDGTETLGPVLVEDHVNSILRRTIASKDTRRLMGHHDPDDAS